MVGALGSVKTYPTIGSPVSEAHSPLGLEGVDSLLSSPLASNEKERSTVLPNSMMELPA